jgi:hypothetical protein
MSTIVTRSGKGSPLTHTEVDNNFTNLNTDKLQSGDTAASLTITSADINGGSIDGTAIGASTASTGAFTTLSASGVATVSAGSVSAPAITTSGDSNTGIFFPAADTIAFTEGGVESMRINSSGNVGIGNTNPGQALSVQRTGEVNFELASTSSGSSELVQKGAGSSVARHVLAASGQTAYSNSFEILQEVGGQATFNNRANSPIALFTNNTERMRIDSSGNVGIGTTSPAQKLHVSSSGSAGVVQLGGTGTTGYFSQINQNANDLTIIANGDQAYRVSLGTNNGSGNIVFQTATGTTGNTTRASITAAGLFQFNSGYGSSATAYGCRAWVNFNGTGTVAIRASGNVSSITDNGTGNYRVNFSTALVDANYSVVAGASKDDGTNDGNFHAQVNGFSNGGSNGNTVNNTTVTTGNSSPASLKDSGVVTVAVFR